MPKIVITNVGVAQAISLMESGLKLRITNFKLGSSVNYTPLVTESALRGSVVYSAAITEVIQSKSNQITFKIVVPSNEGPFTFGEIGLYTDTNVLFALISLESSYSKQATTSSDKGDTFRINIPINIDNAITNLEFTTVSVTQHELTELSSINLLPDAAISPSNTYLIQNTNNKRKTVAVASSIDTKWYFLDYNPLVEGNVISSGPGTVTFSFNGNLPNLTQIGDFILQGTNSATQSQSVLALTLEALSSNTYRMTYDNSIVGFGVGSTIQVWIHNALVSGLLYQYYAVKDWTASNWSYGNFVLKDGITYLGINNSIQSTDVPGISTKWLPIMDANSPLPANRITGTLADARIPTNIVRNSRTITGSGLVTGGGSLAGDLILTVDAATPAEGIAGVVTNKVMTPKNTKDSVFNWLSSISMNTSGLITGGGSIDGSRTLTVTAANSAEAKSGSSTTTVMTPARTKEAYDYFQSLRTVTGSGLVTGGGALSGNLVLSVIAATNSEAILGISNSTVITPASLKSVLDSKMGQVSIVGTGLATGGGTLSASRTINVAVATEQEAISGVSNSVAMTPFNTYRTITNRISLIGFTGSGNVKVTGAFSTNDLQVSLIGINESLQNLTTTGLLIKNSTNTLVTRTITGSDGISVVNSSNSPNPQGLLGDFIVKADSTVVRTSADQTINGVKTFERGIITKTNGSGDALKIIRTDLASQYLQLWSDTNGSHLQAVSTSVSPKNFDIRVSQNADLNTFSSFIFQGDGKLIAPSFQGNGSLITGLNASYLSNGIMNIARIPVATLAEAQLGNSLTVVMTAGRVKDYVNARVATNPEAVTASDNIKLMTPLRTMELLASKFQGLLESSFQSLEASPGYIKFPGGITMQWGTGIITAFSSPNNWKGSGSVVFPIPFLVDCFTIQLTTIGSSEAMPNRISAYDKTLTGFSAFNRSSGTSGGATFFWFAIGV